MKMNLSGESRDRQEPQDEAALRVFAVRMPPVRHALALQLPLHTLRVFSSQSPLHLITTARGMDAEKS